MLIDLDIVAEIDAWHRLNCLGITYINDAELEARQLSRHSSSEGSLAQRRWLQMALCYYIWNGMQVEAHLGVWWSASGGFMAQAVLAMGVLFSK